MRNVCLHINLNTFHKNKSLIKLMIQNSTRQLRGSRYGRVLGLDKTEAKFQELLKNLNYHHKKYVFNDDDISATTSKPMDLGKRNRSVEKQLPVEDLSYRLERKITPLKKFPYVKQLERKYVQSMRVLKAFGHKLKCENVPITMGADKLPCPVDMMLPSPLIEAYRNHDDFSIDIGIDGNPKTVGFYVESLAEDLSFTCVEPDDLVILKDIHKSFIKDFQNYIRESSLSAFSRKDGKGHWKSVSVRSNVKGDLMGIITFHPQDLSEEQIELEKTRLGKYFEMCQRNYNLKSLYFQSRHDLKPAPYELLLGESHIIEEINDLKFQISPECFFQNNTQALETMLKTIKKLCRVNESTTVLDIFCGVGPLSLLFAPQVRNCIGMDVSAEAISIAKRNAQMNDVSNVEFECGSIETILKNRFTAEYHKDVIAIINPARAELSKTSIEVLRGCKYLKKIIYISTQPKAAIENFLRLCKPANPALRLGKYFVPLLALPVDLYPQTKHYGLVVMFQRL